MPGLINTEWHRYLNGGSPAFNFRYNGSVEIPTPETSPTPVPHQPLHNSQEPPSNISKNKNKKSVQQQGGKRKSRRSRTKKHRRTHRK